MGGETEHFEYQGETLCTPLSPAVSLRLRLFTPLVHSKLCGALSMDTSVVAWDGRCAMVNCVISVT